MAREFCEGNLKRITISKTLETNLLWGASGQGKIQCAALPGLRHHPLIQGQLTQPIWYRKLN